MKERLTAIQIVNRVNELIKMGRKIRVFGLPYPPYQEELVFTDEKINRSGWLCTDSKITLSASACASHIKIRTITGWCSLFRYLDNGQWEDTLDKTGHYVNMKVTEDICPGMIFGMLDKESNLPINLGPIIDIEDCEDEGEEVRFITVCNINFQDNPYAFLKTDLEGMADYFVADMVM